MKIIFSKLICVISAGLLFAACGDDDVAGGGDSTPSLTVTTPVVSAITATTAQVSATTSGTHITARGVWYGTEANPGPDGESSGKGATKVAGTSAEMTLTLAGLKPQTTYHVRAYVQSYDVVKYSEDVTFTTAKAASPEEEEEQTEGPSALKRVSFEASVSG